MKNQKAFWLLLLIFGLFTLSGCGKEEPGLEAAGIEKNDGPLPVKIQTIRDSRSLARSITYPAIITGEKETNIVAKLSGTAKSVNFKLGDTVSTGRLLFSIDDTDARGSSSASSLNSNQIEQASLAVRQAEESYKLAKKNLNITEDAKDTTKSQLAAAKSQKKLADLQRQNARLVLESAVDAHQVITPLSGVVTRKNVGSGEIVSAGQVVAVVSDPSDITLQFFVEKNIMASLKTGEAVSINDGEGREWGGTITAISIEADQATRRFLVEVEPEAKRDQALHLGTITNVELKTTQTPQNAKDFLLPLSAITVGQNENYIFIVEDNRAKKISITLSNVNGETAEVASSDLKEDTAVIIDGNKLVKDGDEVEIQS